MRYLVSIFLAVFFTAASQPRAETPSPQPSISGQERAENLHNQDPREFREIPEVSKVIDFEHIDQHLLAAAVFHETNRRRIENDLEPLKYKHVLREAARIQARSMRREEIVSHQHPDESKKTLSDRLDLLGIKGRFSAENVAMTFGIKYKSGEALYPRRQNGALILSDEPDGPPIPPHTYLSFAEDLLDQWMDSPGHRENIVAKTARFLGASSLHDRTSDGMDRLYSVQVFFAPF